jgi:hypothetical protein
MEHHPDAEEKLMARKLSMEPESPRPVSEDGMLGSTCGAISPIKTQRMMKVMIHEYFS